MGKQEIVAQALKLDPAERFDLVDQLLHSLDKPDPEIDRVWLEEAEERLAAKQQSLRKFSILMKNEVLDHLITTTILKPQYRKYNIEGSPFKIGCKVKISNGSEDSTFDKKYSNKTGEIVFFEYDCGSGQIFPSDPMIGVKFQDGEIEEFWKEELTNI